MEDETSLLRQSLLSDYDLPEDSDLEDGESEGEAESHEALTEEVEHVVPERVESTEVDSSASPVAQQSPDSAPDQTGSVKDTELKVSMLVRIS